MYKCENCRIVKHMGDDVYLVESSFMNIFLPTCSTICATKIKSRELKYLRDKIDKIRNKEIKKNIGNFKIVESTYERGLNYENNNN